jgi:hypothetical protein
MPNTKSPQRPQVTKRGGSHRDYGYTSAPFVYKDQVIVEAGDPTRGNLLAFDKTTGKLLWGSENKTPAGHTGGLALMVIDGVPCVAVLTATHLVVTRLDSGKTVAGHPWATDFINNIPTPAVFGNEVIITSRYNKMAMCKLAISLTGGAKVVWESKSPPKLIQNAVVAAINRKHIARRKEIFTIDGFWVNHDERMVILLEQLELDVVSTAYDENGLIQKRQQQYDEFIAELSSFVSKEDQERTNLLIFEMKLITNHCGERKGIRYSVEPVSEKSGNIRWRDLQSDND